MINKQDIIAEVSSLEKGTATGIAKSMGFSKASPAFVTALQELVRDGSLITKVNDRNYVEYSINTATPVTSQIESFAPGVDVDAPLTSQSNLFGYKAEAVEEDGSLRYKITNPKGQVKVIAKTERMIIFNVGTQLELCKTIDNSADSAMRAFNAYAAKVGFASWTPINKIYGSAIQNPATMVNESVLLFVDVNRSNKAAKN